LEDGIKANADVAYRVCLRATGRAAEAEDAFQNACLELVRRAGQRESIGNLRAWILAHMHRQAVNLRVAEQRQRAHTAAAAASGSGGEIMERPSDQA
jgi:DNA-directed RNA polymerase specialized sigma24 family protein